MTLALPKSGLFEAEGPAHTARLYLADLGLPPRLYDAMGLQVGSPFSGSRIVRVRYER